MELEQPRMPEPPSNRPPRGACDAHSHVFGPYDRFPLVLESSYPPPDSPYERHVDMRASLGLERAVLIQPAPYSTDNSALVDALERAGGSLRGVGVADESADDEMLQNLHSAGVRALRFLEMFIPGTKKRYPGSISTQALQPLAPRMRELGWHPEVWGSVAQCADVAEAFADLGMPIVLDHLAGVNVDTPSDDADFQRVLARVKAGDAWVKLSLCRFSVPVADYVRAKPFHDALLEANPANLVWGTDFPFVRRGENSPDGGYLVDLLHDWTPDAQVLQQILVENPARLYDFPEE
jgi:predicted TIM-barrel fold metal-dependent hydrolase